MSALEAAALATLGTAAFGVAVWVGVLWCDFTLWVAEKTTKAFGLALFLAPAIVFAWFIIYIGLTTE